MSFLDKILKRRKKDRLFVLSLEGVALDLVTGPGAEFMPFLSSLFSNQGASALLAPILPLDSHQSWVTYATGVNPGKHGVFGYLDREPNPFKLVVPDARAVKVPCLWEYFNSYARRIGTINVPVTFPPKRVDGFMIAGLLSPNLTEGAYPFDLAPRLLELDYRIDTDTALAAGDPSGFAEDAKETLSRRLATCLALMHKESWDFMQLHISEADRMNHFLWGALLEPDHPQAVEVRSFYKRLDDSVAELVDMLPPGCELAVLSEHGFCATRVQLFLNRWLEDNGYLLLKRGARNLPDMHPESKAYALTGGRIFVNREDREENGSVPRGAAYEDLRQELTNRLSALRSPGDGEAMVRKVWRREELYSGPRLGHAADLIVETQPGFDPRPELDAPEFALAAPGRGCHTADGAFFFIKGMDLSHESGASMLDAAPTLMTALGLEPSPNLEGRSLI